MIDRRTFLAATVTLSLTPLRAESFRVIIPLWPGEPPGGGGPLGAPKMHPDGSVYNIAMPSLEAFIPTHGNGSAIMIAAGGGYRHIVMRREARPAAEWFAQRGVAAFILCYRLPPEGWHNGPLAPLQDAQRALRIIRANPLPPHMHIDPARVGVLGFSAGGHLMGLAATRPSFQSYQPVDEVDAFSARPDHAALIYPVITLEPPYNQTNTRRSLIGSNPSPAAAAEWSVETYVRPGCPPMFLVEAQDDPIANLANMTIMAEACLRAGVPTNSLSLADGGHGFGMGRPGTASEEWPRRYETWLRSQHMMELDRD